MFPVNHSVDFMTLVVNVSRRAIRLWPSALLIASLLSLVIISACKGSSETDQQSGQRGTLVFLLSHGDRELGTYATDRGELVALEGESLMSTLESNVASDDLGSTSGSGRRVPFVTLDQDTGTVSVIDLSTRQLVRVGIGRMPAFDSSELLAYCDAGATVHVVRIPPEGSIVPVNEVRLPFDSSICPQLAWSRDGQLAILALEQGGRPRLMLFSVETGLRQIDLPPSIGTSPLTWSSDDSMLALSSGHNTYIIQASDGHIAATLGGLSRPVFSPTEPRVLAGFDEQRESVVVRSVVGDSVAEASGVSPRSSIAWSPDGTRIVVAASFAIVEWDIASNDMNELYRPDEGTMILPAVLWVG